MVSLSVFNNIKILKFFYYFIDLKPFDMKKIILLIIMVTWFLCSCSNQEKSLHETLSKGNWIDLSYDFSTETLYWPNNPTGFQLGTTAEGMTPGGFYYSTFAFCAPEHGGIHYIDIA